MKFNLILHEYTYIRWYIKKKRQRESNPSLQRSSPAVKPLRYKTLQENCANEMVYK